MRRRGRRTRLRARPRDDANQSRSSASGMLRVIARWWTSASASVRSGLPRARQVLALGAAPAQGRRRIREVDHERQDRARPRLAGEPVDDVVVGVRRDHVRALGRAHLRVGAVVAAEIPDEPRRHRRAPPRARTRPSAPRQVAVAPGLRCSRPTQRSPRCHSRPSTSLRSLRAFATISSFRNPARSAPPSPRRPRRVPPLQPRVQHDVRGHAPRKRSRSESRLRISCGEMPSSAPRSHGWNGTSFHAASISG